MLPAPSARKKEKKAGAVLHTVSTSGAEYTFLEVGFASVREERCDVWSLDPSCLRKSNPRPKGGRSAGKSSLGPPLPGPARPGLVVWPRSSRTAFLLLGPRALGSTTTTLPCSQRSSEPKKEAACPPSLLAPVWGGVRVGGGGAKTAFLFLATQARPSLLRLRCGRVPDLTDCALVKRTPLEEDVTYRT